MLTFVSTILQVNILKNVGVFFSYHNTACEYLLAVPASREQVYVNPIFNELAPSKLDNVYANSS